MIWEIDPTHSYAFALSTISPRHFFLEQGICPLFVLFDSPPTEAQKEKGVFRGHPEPRQRASPSALPKLSGREPFYVILW